MQLTSRTHEGTALDHESLPGSRRSFLQKATLTAGLAMPALVISGSTARADGLGSLFGFIEEERKLHHFSEIRKHENDHVAFLVQALGNQARPKPTFQNLKQHHLRDFLTLSRTFENTGVGAYLGAAPIIMSKTYLAAAGSILTMEARHAGFLDVLTGQTISPGNVSFDSPLTAAQVGSGVTPFIASLNGGPPVTYSQTASAANDIAILNFALALEYLEAEYYNLNASRFGY